MEILLWKNIAGKEPFHAARDTKTRDRPVRDHGHDFAELFWIDAGKGIHRINGLSVPLRAGSLVLMHPSDNHGIDPDRREGLRLTNIAFPQETLRELQTRYFAGRLIWKQGRHPATHQMEPAQLQRLNRWADELAGSPRERLYLDRFLLNVLVELTGRQEAALPEEAPEWLVRACRAIQRQENFSGGVEQFLHLCGRSREHAARTVRRHLGETPTDYVNAIRMNYARRQLEMGDQQIVDIALDCGIENLSHFYSLFRAQTGVTPRRYRLAHRRPL